MSKKPLSLDLILKLTFPPKVSSNSTVPTAEAALTLNCLFSTPVRVILSPVTARVMPPAQANSKVSVRLLLTRPVESNSVASVNF